MDHPARPDTSRPDASIGRSFSILYRQWVVYADRALAPFGIGSAQVQVLAFLYCNEGVSQDEVCRYLLLDKGSVARSIKRLIEAGYVVREQSEEDHRAYRLMLTELAHRRHDEIRGILRAWSEHVAEGLDEEQRERLAQTLGDMVSRAEELTRAQDAGVDGAGEDADDS